MLIRANGSCLLRVAYSSLVKLILVNFSKCLLVLCLTETKNLILKTFEITSHTASYAFMIKSLVHPNHRTNSFSLHTSLNKEIENFNVQCSIAYSPVINAREVKWTTTSIRTYLSKR